MKIYTAFLIIILFTNFNQRKVNAHTGQTEETETKTVGVETTIELEATTTTVSDETPTVAEETTPEERITEETTTEETTTEETTTEETITKETTTEETITEETTTDAEEGEDEGMETNTKPDYSILNLNYTDYPNGGILVQYTQNGLDYIVRMAEKAVLKLMTNFPIPDTKTDEFTLKNVNVNKFDKPKLLTKFVNQTGMEIKMVIPKMEISAAYIYSGGWVSSEGGAKCNIKNLVVNMLLHIQEGRYGLPAIKIPICEGKIQRFRMVSDDRGWGGTMMNTFRGVAEALVTTTLGDLICFAARNATGMIETIFLKTSEPTGGGLVKEPIDKPTGELALPMNVICGKDMETQTETAGGGGSPLDSMISEIDGLSVDTNIDGSAYFEDNQMVVGLNCEFTFKGNKSGLTPKHLVLPPTERMIHIAVKEILVNSFGVIAQEQKYFEYNEVLDLSELPIGLRTLLTPICPLCQLKLYAVTAKPFRIEMSEFGVKAFLTAFMQISGTGVFKKKRTIVEASFDIESIVHLLIDKNSTLVGSINMEKIEVKIIDHGLAGAVDKPLNALLKKLIPKFLWPAVKKKIDRAINKGYGLPAMCGLSFNNTSIKYVDGAVIVSTDFAYDLDAFVERFLVWQQLQLAISIAQAGGQTMFPPASTQSP